MYKLCDTKRITIGRVGESLVKQIVFDITEWFDEGLQDATYILKYVRPGETQMYQPFIQLDRENRTLTWFVTAIDTGIIGAAQCEVLARGENGENKKTRTIVCVIDPSMDWGPDANIPDAMKGWAERLAILQSQLVDQMSWANTTINNLIEAVNEKISVEKLQIIEDREGYVEMKGLYIPADDYHPVGSYFVTEGALTPKALYGGDWEEITGTVYSDPNRTPGTTGGMETYMITEQNLPKGGT